MSSITDFTNTRREMKYSLYDALDYAKDLEEKFQAMSQLVETLTHANYKKDKKIQKLAKKIKKLKSDARYRDRNILQEEEEEEEELEEEDVPQKEVIDLTQIPEEEETPIIPQPPKIKIEKTAKKVKIEEPLVIIIEEEEIVEEIEEEDVVMEEEEVVEEIEEEEVVEEIEEEEVVEEMVEEIVEETSETEIEEQDEEENIEPELEPDVISEPEENQPTEEPILEKEEEEMELIIEDPEQEEVVEETAEEEEELYEVLIGKSSYYVSNEENGPIYEIAADQEVGEEVGKYVDGKPVFQPKSSTAPELEEPQEEDEVELIQIKINGVNYAVEEENKIDGPIYSLGFDGDVDEEVGKYVNGKPTFYKK